MKMYETISDLEARGAAMKRFAKFMEVATTAQIYSLGAALKAYGKEAEKDDPMNFDFENSAVAALSRQLARRTERSMTHERADEFWELGYMFIRLIYKLALHNAPKEDLDLLHLLFSHAYDVGPEDSIYVSMERITSGGYHASLFKRHADQIEKDKIAMEGKEPGSPEECPYILTHPDIGGVTETRLSLDEAHATLGMLQGIRKEGKPWHMKVPAPEELAKLAESLDAAEYPDLTALAERLDRTKAEALAAGDTPPYLELGVWDHNNSSDGTEIRLKEPEFFAAIEAIKGVRVSAKAEPAAPAELKPNDEHEQDDEDEPVIDEATVLERKFDEFKKENDGNSGEVTIQIWDPVDAPGRGGSDDGINLTEDEFKWFIDRLRRRRAGEEDPEKHFDRICNAVISNPKAFAKACGRLHMEEREEEARRAEEESAPNPEADALVDEMVETFGKLKAVLGPKGGATPGVA
jgi:hypothetical protein